MSIIVYSPNYTKNSHPRAIFWLLDYCSVYYSEQALYYSFLYRLSFMVPISIWNSLSPYFLNISI